MQIKKLRTVNFTEEGEISYDTRSEQYFVKDPHGKTVAKTPYLCVAEAALAAYYRYELCLAVEFVEDTTETTSYEEENSDG